MGRQPAGMDDDDVKKQTTTDGVLDTKVRNKKIKEACRFWCIFMPICFVIAAIITLTLQHYKVDAQYSVATDSVSGLLDPPKTGLTFDLTLRVASRSDGAKACINPGTYVEVFYRRIRVAATAAAQTQQRTCAGPRNTAELPVVATATGLPVGQGLDSLAAEMKEGAAVFDLVLHVPPRSYGGDSATSSWVTVCKGSRVGGAAVVCDSPNQFD